MKIRIINGPNLNMLGVRQKKIYGEQSYEDLVQKIEEFANEKREEFANKKREPEEKGAKETLEVEVLQSNHEGELIDWVHDHGAYDALVVNFGAYSHTSIALMDALFAIKSLDKYIVEVHISNIYAREHFREISYSAKASDAVISGCGLNGYLLAMEQILHVKSRTALV